MPQEGQGRTAPAGPDRAERPPEGRAAEPGEGAGRLLVPVPVQVPDPETQCRIRGEKIE